MERLNGKDGFLTYYSKLFPYNSIDQIIDALNKQNFPALIYSTHNKIIIEKIWEQDQIQFTTLPWFNNAILWPVNKELGTILPGYQENLFYPMNVSSLLPVIAINPQQDEVILDSCAAPGGKTIAMKFGTHQPFQLLCNDLSYHRTQIMREIFQSMNLSDIQVINYPAETIYQKFTDTFDKILLDAPCSSEKHVWKNPKELNQWSTNRIKELQQRQYALVSGLVLALRPGGILVYSTCAVNREENELLIEKVLQKKSDLVKLVPFNVSIIPGESGMQTDPPLSYDLNNVRRIPLINDSRLDPMFVAILQRLL